MSSGVCRGLEKREHVANRVFGLATQLHAARVCRGNVVGCIPQFQSKVAGSIPQLYTQRVADTPCRIFAEARSVCTDERATSMYCKHTPTDRDSERVRRCWRALSGVASGDWRFHAQPATETHHSGRVRRDSPTGSVTLTEKSASVCGMY